MDELVGRLAPRLSRSAEGLVEHDDGVHLQGRFQHGVVAYRGTDGRMQTACVADAVALERALMRDGASGRP